MDVIRERLTINATASGWTLSGEIDAHTAPLLEEAVGTLPSGTGAVLVDIVKSNLTVARLILGNERNITPRFVWVPLAIRDPHGIVALAGIVTMTPGTLSADLSDDRRHLLVHAFDVDDEAAQAALIADIQARYEAPLIRIFEGDRP